MKRSIDARNLFMERRDFLYLSYLSTVVRFAEVPYIWPRHATSVTSALEAIFNEMRYINLRFTYLLTLRELYWRQ